MTLTTTDFVNIHGQKVDTTKRVKLERTESSVPAEYHKGWIVEGLPPGALEEAKAVHEQKRALAIREQAARIPEEWTDAAWLAKARAKRVRAKAYSMPAAALDCKALAEKAGWLRVEVRALSKGRV